MKALSAKEQNLIQHCIFSLDGLKTAIGYLPTKPFGLVKPILSKSIPEYRIEETNKKVEKLHCATNSTLILTEIEIKRIEYFQNMIKTTMDKLETIHEATEDQKTKDSIEYSLVDKLHKIHLEYHVFLNQTCFKNHQKKKDEIMYIFRSEKNSSRGLFHWNDFNHHIILTHERNNQEKLNQIKDDSEEKHYDSFHKEHEFPKQFPNVLDMLSSVTYMNSNISTSSAFVEKKASEDLFVLKDDLVQIHNPTNKVLKISTLLSHYLDYENYNIILNLLLLSFSKMTLSLKTMKHSWNEQLGVPFDSQNYYNLLVDIPLHLSQLSLIRQKLISYESFRETLYDGNESNCRRDSKFIYENFTKFKEFYENLTKYMGQVITTIHLIFGISKLNAKPNQKQDEGKGVHHEVIDDDVNSVTLNFTTFMNCLSTEGDEYGRKIDPQQQKQIKYYLQVMLFLLKSLNHLNFSTFKDLSSTCDKEGVDLNVEGNLESSLIDEDDSDNSSYKQGVFGFNYKNGKITLNEPAEILIKKIHTENDYGTILKYNLKDTSSKNTFITYENNVLFQLFIDEHQCQNLILFHKYFKNLYYLLIYFFTRTRMLYQYYNGSGGGGRINTIASELFSDVQFSSWKSDVDNFYKRLTMCLKKSINSLYLDGVGEKSLLLTNAFVSKFVGGKETRLNIFHDKTNSSSSSNQQITYVVLPKQYCYLHMLNQIVIEEASRVGSSAFSNKTNGNYHDNIFKEILTFPKSFIYGTMEFEERKTTDHSKKSNNEKIIVENKLKQILSEHKEYFQNNLNKNDIVFLIQNS